MLRRFKRSMTLLCVVASYAGARNSESADEPHPVPPFEANYWFNYYSKGDEVVGGLQSGVTVTDKFDSGFRIVAQEIVTNRPSTLILLNITRDPYSDFDREYFGGRFYFKVANARDVPLTVRVRNADWSMNVVPNYNIRATYDNDFWFQVNTSYTFLDGVVGHQPRGELEFSLTPTRGVVWFATWAVHPFARTEANVARWQKDRRVHVQVIGQSLDHRDIHLVRVGQPESAAAVRCRGACTQRRRIWVIAGQHPSEKQGVFAAEGLLDALVDPDRPTSLPLLEETVFYVVPNVNPDGNYLGHVRTNRDGVNLKRAWGPRTDRNSPETFAVQAAMAETGVDFFMDLHANPHHEDNFFFYPSPPGWDAEINATRFAFERAMKAVNPEYLGEESGYLPPDPPGKGPTYFSDAWTANRFQCVAATMEFTSKDLPMSRNETTGFSPQRAREWGASFLDALLLTLPYIRNPNPAI